MMDRVTVHEAGDVHAAVMSVRRQLMEDDRWIGRPGKNAVGGQKRAVG